MNRASPHQNSIYVNIAKNGADKKTVGKNRVDKKKVSKNVVDTFKVDKKGFDKILVDKYIHRVRVYELF